VIDQRRIERTTNLILYFATNTQSCTKTKLMHLLYMLDFEHFKATGRSVTDELYCALASGPVPNQLYWELNLPAGIPSFLDGSLLLVGKEKGEGQFVPLVPFIDDDLTRRQLTLMERLAAQYYSDTGEALATAVCAKGTPWDRIFRGGCGQCAHIPYELALEDSPHKEQLLEAARDYQRYRFAAPREKTSAEKR
jgi:uncharacterized phage-associated protein